MKSVKTRPPSLTALEERWVLEFVNRLKDAFAERLLGVINYNWIIEDFEDEPDEFTSVELVVVIRDYSFAKDSKRVFEISTTVELENGFEVMLFPSVYDGQEFGEHAMELPYEAAFIVREGRVIYDAGFVSQLRKGQPASGR